MNTTYETTLTSNKVCWKCGKKMMSGELVTAEIYTKERYYPIKGLMSFQCYRFSHLDCAAHRVTRTQHINEVNALRSQNKLH